MNTADFWRIYRALRKRRNLVLGIVGTTVGLVLVVVLVLPRYYQAQALLLPSSAALGRSALSDTRTDIRGDRDQQTAQVANLVNLGNSDTVMGRAAKSLRLGITPKGLKTMVAVAPLPNSTMLQVSVMAPDRTQARSLANAVAVEFADFYQELNQQQTQRTRRFLEDQLAAAGDQMRSAEGKLAAFKAKRPEANPPGTAPIDINGIQRERDTVEVSLRGTNAQLEATKAALAGQTPTRTSQFGSTDNAVISQIQTQLVIAESDLATQLANHTPEHPAVIALRTRIANLREQLRKQMVAGISQTHVDPNPVYQKLQEDLVNLRTESVAAAARLSALNGTLARWSRQAGAQSAQGVTLASLMRGYRLAEENYQKLSAALTQARMDENVARNQDAIRIVELADSAQGPLTKGAQPWQLLLLAFVASGGMAIGLALLLEFGDDRISSPEAAWRTLELPVSGMIPRIPSPVKGMLPPVAMSDPLSPYAEAYRFLKTDLVLGRTAQVRTLMVASARPGQGATTTAANLAVALAESAYRVILVDGDMRRPSLHKMFGTAGEPGLSSMLFGWAGLDEALHQTQMPNLVLMPAGPSPANPAALLSLPRMRALLEQLKERADYVVFDTPSAGAFTDGLLLAPMLDGVLMIVRAREAARRSEQQVRGLLDRTGAQVLGVVLNDLPPEVVDSFYFHSRYYGSEQLAAPPEPLAISTPPPPALPSAEMEQPAPAADAPEVAAGNGKAAEPVDPQPAAEMAASGSRRTQRGWLAGLVVLCLAGAALALRITAQPRQQAPLVARPAPAAAALDLVGHVSKPAQIRVMADGRLLYEGTLLPGDFPWRAEREITVYLPNPQAVEFTLNGKRIGALGRKGDARLVRTFTLEDARSAAGRRGPAGP